MTCPTCHGPTSVIETRQARDGMRRRRHCDDAKCGAKFTTLEHIDGLPRKGKRLIATKDLDAMATIVDRMRGGG